MCGLAGYLAHDNKPVDSTILSRMNHAIRHRGPDGSSDYIDGNMGLTHRRLAIIDLSSNASQPMASECGRYVIAYNGEVYNFRELRRELQAAGVTFRSHSDTEVVLAALSLWGTEALNRLNGMFAFALWDRQERKLLLARDRYGIKPLYYAETAGYFIFGSEIKALLAHGDLQAAIDPAGMAEYLGFQNFFTNRTLFRQVRMLPAGCALHITAGQSVRIDRYWDFHFAEPETERPVDEYIEQLDELFRNAVRRQLVSDVPISTYLSGGMDTGAIAALAAREMPNLFSFTIGFDLTSASGLELGFDERRTAERMSYLFRTEHYEMVLKAGDMERSMQSLVWHLEEPRVGQSYPNYYAAKLASRFGKVVLSGAAGDELFAGYPWRYYRAVVNDNFDHYVDKYFDFWQRLMPPEDHSNLLAPLGKEATDVSLREIFRSVFSEHAESMDRPEDYVNHSLYFEAKTFLHGVLTVEDKLSMAHGLETRLPFLDNDLVDFAQRVPVRAKLGQLDAVIRLDENEPGPKIQRYFDKTRDGKLLLRSLMQRYVPHDVANGIKQGFSAPDASWFRGESIDYVRRTLMTNSARVYDFLDRKAVQRLVSQHLSGQENRRLLIWSLLYLEEWCRLFLDNQKIA